MLVASVGVVSLGVSNAYADEVADGTRTDVTAIDPMGIQPRESWPNKPYWFNFQDETNCVSPTTGWKDDNSSFWVNVTQWSGLAYCNFYADAYVGGWIDCTTPGYGRVAARSSTSYTIACGRIMAIENAVLAGIARVVPAS